MPRQQGKHLPMSYLTLLMGMLASKKETLPGPRITVHRKRSSSDESALAQVDAWFS